jgi:hypothetical protein
MDVDTSPSTTLLAEAAEAEMLVLGSHERTAWCPVVVVWPHANLARGKGGGDVVVGIDGSATSRRTLQWAFIEASLWRTELRSVHAWEPPGLGGLEPAELKRAQQEHAALLSECLAG